MDVHNGEVLAMGSSPTFDPSIFTRPITQRQYEALVSRKNDAPLANRAIQGALSDRARPSSRSRRWPRSTTA